MSGGSYFRGTGLESDFRFKNKDKELKSQLQNPSCYSSPVNLKKVNLLVMQKWITKELLNYLPIEDEILVSMVFNWLEASKDGSVVLDPKELQLQITGFLGKKSVEFMEDLWNMLLSAQEDPDGIPAKLLEEKKNEISEKKQKEIQTQKKIIDRINSDIKDINEINKKEIKESSSYSPEHSRKDHKSEKSNSNNNNNNNHKHHHHHHHHHHHEDHHHHKDKSRSRSRSKSDDSSSESDRHKKSKKSSKRRRRRRSDSSSSTDSAKSRSLSRSLSDDDDIRRKALDAVKPDYLKNKK